MKKILATLLVATMLLSCVSVVSFAEAPTFYTEANYPFAAIGTFDSSTWSAGPVRATYQSNFNAVTGLTPPESPIFAAIIAAPSGNATIPETATTKDMVVLPLYVGGDGILSWDIDVEFDPDYLTYVKAEAIGTMSQGTINNETGVTNVNAFFAADTKGTMGYLFFKVNAGAKGDAGLTTTTTNVVIKSNEIKTLAGADVALGTSTMAVNLSGLEKGTPVEDPAAEAKDIPAVYGPFETNAEEGYEELKNRENAEFVEADKDTEPYAYNAHGAYRVYFGKFVAAGLKTPYEQGIKFDVHTKDGVVTIHKAAKTTTAAGDAYGILLYGMGSQTVIDNVVPYIINEEGGDYIYAE